MDNQTHAALVAFRDALDRLLKCFKSHNQQPITKQDLMQMEERLNMKQSEVKAIVANATGKAKEALAEINTRITALQTQLDKAIADASDPEITDEAFLATMNELKDTTQALADIVPNPEAPPNG